jgi:hypothetical protein
MTAKMAKRSARARERHRHGSSSLKVLDPERPIREAGMNHGLSFVGESAADFGSVELSSRFQSLSELEFLTRAAFPTSKGTIAV